MCIFPIQVPIYTLLSNNPVPELHHLNLEEQFHNNNMPASYARANHSSHNNSLQSVSRNLKYVLSAFDLAPMYTADTKELVAAQTILLFVEYYPTISMYCPVLSL